MVFFLKSSFLPDTIRNILETSIRRIGDVATDIEHDTRVSCNHGTVVTKNGLLEFS